jgi:putative hydrolase of the HAD superfamily
MGVIYRSGDDVAEVLVPYLRDLGCSLPTPEIETLYLDASLGQMTSREFWAACEVDGDDEQYCARHELMPGILEPLHLAVKQGIRVACLSNDESEWSVQLRSRFALSDWVETWVISGDIGVRKPNRAAYQRLVEAMGVRPEEINYIDDRPTNVEAAREVGLHSEVFASPRDIRM